MNRSYIFLIVLLTACSALQGESRTFIYNRFYLHYENLSPSELDELTMQLDRAEAFFALRFNYKNRDSLDIIITPSVQVMCSYLMIPSWIGGYYKRGRVFIQPVAVLKKKAVLEKVIFTEIAHDQIDSYTAGRCPPWFNEAASYYYYLLSGGSPGGPVITELYFSSYSSLTALKDILKDKAATHAFYRESLAFILYLNSIKSGFCLGLFEKLHEGSSFEEAVADLTGKTPEQLYAEFTGSLKR